MLKRVCKIALVAGSASVLLASCGGGGAGGGSAELATSFVTASAKTAVLDSDVIAWVDATGTKTTACSNTSFASTPAADSVDVEVISKAYSNTGSMGLPIRVEKATISYSPANSATPAMATEYQTIGTVITNGSTATIPVRIASQEQKERLQSKLGCAATIYNYYAKITLDITEIGTNTKSSVDTSMQLRLADFIDK